MCGIAGYIGLKNLAPGFERVNKCLSLMEVRGPDGINFRIINNNFNKQILLHSRLSIIDPSTRSNQPMEDEKGIIIFNGLIYNYLELKKKLKYKGIKFKTNSDTEVLLKVLNEYGKKAFNLIEGMWSFYYYSKKTKISLISRDRFGEKPLYYSLLNKSLFFGSNVNYIIQLSKKKYLINYEKIQKGLNGGYKTFYEDRETFFKGIYLLEPGNYIEIRKGKISNTKKYFKKKVSIKNRSYLKTKKELYKVLKKDFSKSIRSDFPVACLLSGGIDSNLVAAFTKKYIKKKFECFSIKNKDSEYNENSLIDKAVKKLKIKHTYVKIKKKDSIQHLENLIKKTSSIIPTVTWMLYSMIIKKLKNKGFKVVLGGTGGDEFFAGYLIHHLYYLKSLKKDTLKFNNYYKSWSKDVRPLIRSKYLNDFNFFMKNSEKTNSNLTPFLENQKLIKKVKKIKSSSKKILPDSLKNFLLSEIYNSSLPAQLYPADNISMYHGVENRSPILSKDIYKLSFSSPNDYLLRNGYGKYILRDVTSKLIHKKISWSRNKVGFYTDIKNIFNTSSKKFKKKLFQSKKINSFINKKEIEKLLNSKKKISNSQSHFIFSILNFSILEKYYGAK